MRTYDLLWKSRCWFGRRVSGRQGAWPRGAALLAAAALAAGMLVPAQAQVAFRAEEAPAALLPADPALRDAAPLPADAPPAAEPVPAAPGLTLADLEHLALAGNPAVVRAAAEAGAAYGRWVQVGLPPNPIVGYEGQQLGSGGLAEQHGVVIGQEFVLGGKLRLSRAVAARELEQARERLAVAQQRVLTDVRVAYYQVLLAQRQIDITADLVRISEAGQQAAEAIFAAKEGNKVDVLQAQLEVQHSLILLQNARNRHQAAWQALSAVVNQPGLAPQPLAGDAYAAPLEFDFELGWQRLISSSPEVAVAATNLARARAALERARVEPRPNVTVAGLVNWQDNGIGGQPDGALGVTLPVPLWNRNQGGILAAQHEVAAAQQALVQLELDLRQRLAAVFERYQNARQQVDRYRTTILAAAEESLDLTRKLYAAGEINYVNLLTAQRTFSQTSLSYLDALRELRVAEAEIDGLLLSGSLRPE